MQAVLVARKRRLTGSLGERIQALLADQEQTVTWLADEVGINRVTLSKLLHGHISDPAVSIVQRIAAALKVTVGELLDG